MSELFSTATSYFFFHIMTHPGSSVRQRLPLIKLKRLELYPCLRLHLQTRVIHIHHWMYWSLILLISIPTHFKLLDSNLLQGFMFGGALQGFLINHKSRRLIYSLPLERSNEYR